MLQYQKAEGYLRQTDKDDRVWYYQEPGPRILRYRVWRWKSGDDVKKVLEGLNEKV